ncbi:MAG: FKBP-type peptidyl-prolyl cis-trans isomerase [Candidatus Bathyarchaeia archaeon]
MPINDGDFILVEYTGKVKETGETFETTDEEEAKNEGLYRAGEVYEPRLIIVGQGLMLKEVEERLKSMDVGKTETIEVPPEKAFGLRDQSKIKTVPLRRFSSRKINPTPGMRVELDGKLATVRSVGAGRVQLDFNPPLAGKTLVYEITVKEKLMGELDKVLALTHRRFPTVDVNRFKIDLTENEVMITLPEEAFYLEGVQLMKRGVAMDILKFFPNISNVKFLESFRRTSSVEAAPLQAENP